ncbi:MAG: CDP-diacylglycerol--serine O-phosphatidyltransferase [Deltaproteobacteria bacterium]|nr:CDP-diacylglycerol--serine O-phosphatidyltransferase [Deltaproteobacteria bacterium]
MKIQRQGMKRGVALLPNLLTTANLFCGFFSITKAIQGDYVFAAWMIILAGFFDGLDGRLARLTHTQSDFGIEYDSLSDLTTFCMAPAVLMFTWALNGYGKFGIAACFLFFACGALRLARFNIQADGVEKVNFQGLPTPSGGGFCAATLVFHNHLFGSQSPPSLVILIMVVGLGLLMVSNVKYRSFKKIKRASFLFMICMVGIIFIVAAQPEVMFFVIGVVYVTSGIIEWIWKSPEKIRNLKDLIQRFFDEKRRDSEYFDEGDLVIDPDDEPIDDEDNDVAVPVSVPEEKNHNG